MHWQLLGERRAISLFLLGFYTTVFFLVALAQGGAWARCFIALAGAYGLAFFALAAEYFWARWYALGIAANGITLAVLGLVTTGWHVELAIWGVMHLCIYLPLLGESMAARYDGQEAWRRKYHLDEQAVERIKRSVKGAGTALPTLIFYSLAPREGRDLALLLVLMAGLGVFGLLRMRFWGVALLGATAVATLASVLIQLPANALSGVQGFALSGLGLLAVAFLLWTVSPFVIPAYRFLHQPSR